MMLSMAQGDERPTMRTLIITYEDPGWAVTFWAGAVFD